MRFSFAAFTACLLASGAGFLPGAVAQGTIQRTTTQAPQTTTAGDSVTAPAAETYTRGVLGRFFLGKHYRPVWAMPVAAPVFRPAKLHGGLKPLKTGGSMQTLNLRLADPQGHQYVLRSVDKDLARALPVAERTGLKARLLQDQTSAVHPYGALLAAALAEAAGVYHARPVLYRVPLNENVLGEEFQHDFAGRLVYLEERPDGDWRGQPVFGSAPAVVSSEKMLRHRYAAPGTDLLAPAVDVNGPAPARAYLRARLLDIFLGDWSRREDQWRWARQDAPAAENATPRYRAIPRDRDHAFSHYGDGFFPALAVLFSSKVVTFGPKIGNVRRYTRTTEALDHVLLGWLSEADFKAEADSLLRRFSDATLDRALTAWPTNVQRLDGIRFRRMLVARRGQLPQAAQQLYRLLNRDVELPGSDGPDDYALNTGDNGRLTITWTARLDSSGRHGASTYSRTFDARVTKRIRVHGLGGNDKLHLAGNLPARAPQVTFFDGPGRDRATRAPSVETPRWLRLQPADGDANDFDALPAWCRKPAAIDARDWDASGFLLHHRLD